MSQNRELPEQLGIYIHVPFCANRKCPYCDFYSVPANPALREKYIEAAERDLKRRADEAADRTVDTVYFGGGTPSLLGKDLARLLCCVKEYYDVAPDAEVTFEANPNSIEYETLAFLRKAGFNRLSLGMQSAVPEELKLLGRRHTNCDVENAVNFARAAGFDNISLDLMLCVPGQTLESLEQSVDFAASLSPQHISAYILKVEKGTKYSEILDTLNLPDDDTQADMYLAACDALEKRGYFQYEISNFARPGRQSRHNLKYWNCDEYLGFGPAAHSFFNGRRFYYPRGLDKYLEGENPVDDGEGGALSEYIMLRLRLCEGLSESEMKSRYGVDFSAFDPQILQALQKANLINLADGRLRLTRNGFLVSNSVIGQLIFHQNY